MTEKEEKIIDPLLPENFGCRPDPEDPRDYQFGEVAGAPPADMPSWEKGYDVEEQFGHLRDEWQGQAYNCVGMGGTSDIEMSIHALTGRTDIELSQRDAYSQIHLEDDGASPRDLYKLANQKGICEFELMPLNLGRDLTEAEARKKGQTPETIANALQWRIGNYYSINPNNWDLVKQAIFQNLGCGTGYRPYGASMGHFIFLRGYGLKNGLKALKYRDSYPPYEKWIVRDKNGRLWLDRVGGTQIEMFSVWTADPGDWKKKEPIITQEITNEQVRQAWLKRPDLQKEFPASNKYVSIHDPNYDIYDWAMRYGPEEMPEIFDSPKHITNWWEQIIQWFQKIAGKIIPPKNRETK